MKAAFVLGLAVAANAQVDNEFVSFNPTGANLVKNAGWSQSHPSGIRHPIDYNTQYLNKYGLKHDDVADDEMMVYYTKDSRGVKHYEGGLRRDDAADDEMMVFYTKDSNGVRHYTGASSTYPAYNPVRRDDATDDEMMVYYTKDRNGVKHYIPTPSYVRRDDTAADDELAELVKLLVEYKVHERKPLLNRRKDDDVATDDELAELAKLIVEYKVHERKPLLKRRDDDITDDELAELRQLLVEYKVHERKPLINRRKDDATDDELVQTFYSPSGADLVKYAKQSQQTVYRPTAHVVRDDEADDELAELRKMLVEYRVHERKPLINRRLRYVQLE